MLRQITSLVIIIGSTDALQPLNKPSSFAVPTRISSWVEGQDTRATGPLAAKVPAGQCIKRLAPSLLFIGQAYSGSTSLSDQMRLHPQLDYGSTKEHQWFQKDYTKIQEDKQFENYLEQFWVSCNATVAYDATMDYLMLGLGSKNTNGLDSIKYVKQRLGKDLKLMVMLRDPVDLIFHKACQKGATFHPFTVDKPFNISNNEERPSQNLARWMKVFPNKENWLFLRSDEYFANPQKVLNKVYEFAGVGKMSLDSEDLAKQDGRRRCASRASREQRQAYWGFKDNQDDKKQLEDITGLRFGWKKE